MTIYPNVGALKLAATVRTLLATSTLKLYKTLANPLSPGTVLGDFTEADYDGYAAKTVTAWLAPYLDPAGGASIQSGTQQFDFAASGGVTNNVLGFYLLTAAGVLFFAGDFPNAVPMTQDGDSIPLNLVLNYGSQA